MKNKNLLIMLIVSTIIIFGVLYFTQTGSSNSLPITTSCTNNPCGFPVENGVCDGNGNVYNGGYCGLGCQTPSTNYGDTRIVVGECSRHNSIKCSDSGVCNPDSCGYSNACTTITGSWQDISYPGNGFLARGQDFIHIYIYGISTNTFGWVPLVECNITKNDTTKVILDYWALGNVRLDYQIKSTDPLGYWSIDGCKLYSDFPQNGGWELVPTPAGEPIEHKSSPIPLYSQWWIPFRHRE